MPEASRALAFRHGPPLTGLQEQRPFCGYSELPITSDHVVATEGLPAIHRDPFDRVLLAQATVEGITPLTVDTQVASYPGPVRKV